MRSSPIAAGRIRRLRGTKRPSAGWFQLKVADRPLLAGHRTELVALNLPFGHAKLPVLPRRSAWTNIV